MITQTKRLSAPIYKLGWLAALLAACLFLSACAGPPQLPESAQAALTAYWQSLPPYPDVDHRIIEAWPADGAPPGAPTTEVWCVEAEVVNASDPVLDGERLIWIVLRANDTAPWTAALLMTMSAEWPYQACGQGH